MHARQTVSLEGQAYVRAAKIAEARASTLARYYAHVGARAVRHDTALGPPPRADEGARVARSLRARTLR